MNPRRRIGSWKLSILNEIADLKLIPITQEIDLCKRHLAIMGFRKEITYTWQDSNIDPTENLPPAVIHTMVENGVTHSIAQNGEVAFHLTYSDINQVKTYELLTVAGNRAVADKKEGTGFKYIRSRLQESYGDRWNLAGEIVDDRWKTIITIKA